MKLWIVLLKFIFIGALFIVSNQNLYLNVEEDRAEFIDRYHSWFEGLYEHSLEITGYVINSEWLPKNNGTDTG